MFLEDLEEIERLEGKEAVWQAIDFSKEWAEINNENWEF
jgi:hypothetical protein